MVAAPGSKVGVVVSPQVVDSYGGRCRTRTCNLLGVKHQAKGYAVEAAQQAESFRSLCNSNSALVAGFLRGSKGEVRVSVPTLPSCLSNMLWVSLPRSAGPAAEVIAKPASPRGSCERRDAAIQMWVLLGRRSGHRHPDIVSQAQVAVNRVQLAAHVRELRVKLRV